MYRPFCRFLKRWLRPGEDPRKPERKPVSGAENSLARADALWGERRLPASFARPDNPVSEEHKSGPDQSGAPGSIGQSALADFEDGMVDGLRVTYCKADILFFDNAGNPLPPVYLRIAVDPYSEAIVSCECIVSPA